MADDSRPRQRSEDLAGTGQHSNAYLIRRLLALAWRYRLGCAIVLSQQVLLVVLTLGGVGLAGLGIDYLRHQVDPSAQQPIWPLGLEPPADWSPGSVVSLIAGIIVVVALLYSSLRYVAIVSAAKLVERIVVRLRADVYDKLQRLSFRFFDANESGSIINRVAGDVQAVRMFVDGVIIQVLSVLLSLAVYVTYMLRIHVPLTLACLATTPLLWIGAAWFSRVVRPAYRHNSTLVDKMILALSESIQGIHVVKGFAREPQQIDLFRNRTQAVRAQKGWIFHRIALFQPTIGMLTQVNMIVLLGYGGYLVVAGELRLGEGLFVFANVLQQFANQVGQITNIANSIQTSLTGAQRVFEVLDAPIEIESKPDAIKLSRFRGAVQFDSVSFGYDPSEPVLRDISFEARPGQCIAVVGATGAGKSTLLSMIPRFYDPNAGRVLLDGVDIRELDLDDLRKNVGLVFQESFLFSNTVAANIAFGHPEATREQIEEAALIAAAHEFIVELPNGYDTVIGERGSDLSGGQKQRLAIARAILLEPSILILDDATAAIDPETEHEILEAMENAMAGRTTFVIAHRLSTLRQADLVIVLEHGQIAQIGTHEELMVEKGHYRRAAQMQMAGAEGRGIDDWLAEEFR